MLAFTLPFLTRPLGRHFVDTNVQLERFYVRRYTHVSRSVMEASR